MTSGDERRDMPPPPPAQGEDSPYPSAASSLFRPVSTENRITGGGGHRRSQTVPTPGSSYTFGRAEKASDLGIPLYLKSTSSLPTQAGQTAGDTAPVPYRAGEPYAVPGRNSADTFFQPLQPIQPAPVPYRGEPHAAPGRNSADTFSQPLHPIQPAPVPYRGETHAAPGRNSADTFSQPLQPLQPAPVPYRAGESYTAPGRSGADVFSQPLQPLQPVPVPYRGEPHAAPGRNSVDTFSQPLQPLQPAPVPYRAGESYAAPGRSGAGVQHPQPPQGANMPAYAPKHGAPSTEAAARTDSLPEQTVDPWVTLGWKAPIVPRSAGIGTDASPWPGSREVPSFSNSNAFPPFTGEKPAAEDNTAGRRSQSFSSQAVTPQSPSLQYPPAPIFDSGAHTAGRYSRPYEAAASAAYPPVLTGPETSARDSSGRSSAVPPPSQTPQNQPVQAPKPSPRNAAAKRTLKQSWRISLLILCSIAVLFCVVEVARMVQSLMVNEQELKTGREQLSALAGVDPDATAAAVELLPAGQTYAPTDTPVPIHTPTPEPRVEQNDPLIGVLDSGGEANDVQTAQPSVTTPGRTKLAAYPDNPLLSVSDEFTALLQQNPDVVGKLTINGVLDETLVQRNNTYYLTHNTRGVMGYGGAVFVDEGILLKKPPENLLIRGQATEEGKLLQPLAQYGTAGKAFVLSHGIVTCHTLYEQADYVVFAVVHADSSTASPDYFNYAGYPTFQTDEQMLAYVQNAQNRSVYPIAVGVKASDRLLTLATLPENGDTACWVVLCRMLRSGETAAHIQTD